MSAFSKLLSWARSKASDKDVVRLDADGFEVVGRGTVKRRVAWAAVVEIAAFKRDLFTFDEICLGFRSEGSDHFQAAGEQDMDFDLLRKEVVRRFPGVPPDWFYDVMIPAFEEKWTTIWQKNPSK